MSYIATGFVPGQFPGFPGGLPGPIQIAPGPVGPTMPTSMFPTHTRVGDVVTISGPFGGLMQGQVRVKFEGSSWLSPSMMGPATASVVVPEGSVTGLCEVEVNGRRVFGTNCVIEGGTERVGRPSHKGRSVRAWTQKGELMGYIATGAIALRPTSGAPTAITAKIAPRPSPLPSIPTWGSSLSTKPAIPVLPPTPLLPRPTAPAPVKPTGLPTIAAPRPTAPTPVKPRPRPFPTKPTEPKPVITQTGPALEVPVTSGGSSSYNWGGGGGYGGGYGGSYGGASIPFPELETEALPELEQPTVAAEPKKSVLPLVLVGAAAAIAAYFTL